MLAPSRPCFPSRATIRKGALVSYNMNLSSRSARAPKGLFMGRAMSILTKARAGELLPEYRAPTYTWARITWHGQGLSYPPRAPFDLQLCWRVSVESRPPTVFTSLACCAQATNADSAISASHQDPYPQRARRAQLSEPNAENSCSISLASRAPIANSRPAFFQVRHLSTSKQLSIHVMVRW